MDFGRKKQREEEKKQRKVGHRKDVYKGGGAARPW
jgi:hypothetical protein